MSARSVGKVLEALGIDAKKRGREWVALCPNHDDRNPSWHIRDEPDSPKHALHHCWSCGFKGTVVDLVMLVRGVDWREAKAWLGEDAPAPVDVKSVEVNVKVPGRGFQFPPGVHFGALGEWVTPARDYARTRHLSEGQVARWGLGYAADGPLAGRIVVPYRDRAGVLGGYTARTFVGSIKRYKEPDEREGADPGIMFGEQHWQTVPRGTVFVAEGAFNALAVERALGEVSVAATAGSNLRAAHAAKLSLFERIVVLTDPDPAGDKLAADICGLSRHSKIVRVRLQEGADADSVSEEELRERVRGGIG